MPYGALISPCMLQEPLKLYPLTSIVSAGPAAAPCFGGSLEKSRYNAKNKPDHALVSQEAGDSDPADDPRGERCCMDRETGAAGWVV